MEVAKTLLNVEEKQASSRMIDVTHAQKLKNGEFSETQYICLFVELNTVGDSNR